MTDVIDRQERHTAAATAWGIAKGAAVLIGYYLVVAVLVALTKSETPTLAYKIVMAIALAAGFVYPFFLAVRSSMLDDKIRKGLDQAFSDTTWISLIDGKIAKGVFIGASDDLRSMNLSLENGAISDVRIDHAMPVGHELRTPGQYIGLSHYEAGLVAAERRDVLDQLRIGSLVVGCGSIAAALFAGVNFPWASGPFIIAALSSLIVYGICEGEKDDLAKDREFIDHFSDLEVAAASETAIAVSTTDQSIQAEVARTADSKLRIAVIVGNHLSCLIGTVMVMRGAFPLMQYSQDDLKFGLHQTIHPAVFPEHAATWLFAGLLLIGVSLALRFGFDRKFLLPASRFNRHRWVSVGGAAGRVEHVESGGEVLFLRFDDNTVGKYPIKYLRRGDVITA
jgi:hypothetical protein